MSTASKAPLVSITRAVRLVAGGLALGGLAVAGLVSVGPANPSEAVLVATAAAPIGGGPQPGYRCAFNVNTDAWTGAYGTASAIGWLGNHEGVVTCLGGTFLVQDGPDGLFQDEGFGIYDGQRTTWADADGYLPAQVTTFRDQGATVSITEFADRVVLSGDPYVAVYCRVRVTNPTGRAVSANPDASPALVPLSVAPDTVAPHRTVQHDYVTATDRFGSDDPWPSAQALTGAGGFDQHFAHMRAFWNSQLATIAHISVPDHELVDAYESGFISTQIRGAGTISTRA